MTKIKCNKNDCFGNQEGLCQNEDIELEMVDLYTLECLDYWSQHMEDIRKKLRHDYRISIWY